MYSSFGRSKERAIELLVNAPVIAIDTTSNIVAVIDVSGGMVYRKITSKRIRWWIGRLARWGGLCRNDSMHGLLVIPRLVSYHR